MTGPAVSNDRRPLLCGLIVVVAIVLTFGRVCGHEFVGAWDDGPLIVDNPLINPPTPEGFVKIWEHPHARMYIPAVYSVWWGLARVATVPDAQTGGWTLNPYVYHAANLLVHAISGLLVFGILRLLVKNDLAACAGALLFVLHPLQTEAVAWATGMKDLLSGALSLAALWQYLKFATANRRQWLHYVIATAALIAALFAKPAAVVVPLMAFSLDVLVIGRGWRRSARALWPWMVLIVPCLIWTSLAQPTPEIIPPSLWQRPIIALDSLGFYLAKLAWPARLGIDYGLRPNVIVHTYWWLATMVVAAGVAASRSRWALAGASIFVLGVLPVLGLTPFVFQGFSTVADRYVYLSMLAPALVVAAALAHLQRAVARWAVAILIAALATRSFVQAGTWADIRTLSEHALWVNPTSPVANNNLGAMSFKQADYAAARARFAIAVGERPDYLPARDNLAASLIKLGRLHEATDLMKQTLAMRLGLPAAIRQPIAPDLQRLADVLRAQGRNDEAERYDAERRALDSAGP